VESYIAIHLNDRHRLGNYPEIGFWMNYFVYEIPNHLLPRLDLDGVSCIKMKKDVAMSWKFANSERDHIKVMKGEDSVALKQLGYDNPNLEEHNEYKYKYFLTEEDYKNTTTFVKLVAAEELRKGFNRIWELEKPRVPEIYLELDRFDLLTDKEISDRLLEYKKNLLSYYEMYRSVETYISNASSIREAVSAMTLVTETINPEIKV
jgi:DNA-directed RNA polymerase beta' subunit